MELRRAGGPERCPSQHPTPASPWRLRILVGGLGVGLLLTLGAPQVAAQDPYDDEGIPIEPPPTRRLEDRDLKGELLVAIETRDHASALNALQAGANVGLNIGEPSALATAALLNDLRMVLILLKAGAHPNATADSPLAEAIRSDNREMVDLFLQIGAEVPGRATPAELFESAQGGTHAEWFYTVLMDRQCDPQLGLRSAVIHNRPALAQLTLQRGASLEALPPGPELLRDVAADELPEILDGLLTVAPAEPVQAYFFDVALSTGNRLLVDALVERGAPVRLAHIERAMADGKNDLATHLLDVYGGPEAVGRQAQEAGLPLLAEYVADESSARTETLIRGGLIFVLPALAVLIGVPMLLRRSQRSPATLHRAVSEGNVSLVSRLLDRGADSNGKHSQTYPLHVAVAHGHLTVVRMLLSRGAAVDRRADDVLGYTPLHVAASTGNRDIAEALLKSKCPVDVRATNGQTPLYVAASSGQRPMVEWFLQQRANVEQTVREGETLLMHAIAHRDVEAVSALLAAGANANPAVPTKPLHRVAISGQAGMARLLLQHGADVNTTDANGATPLQVALHHHQVEVGEILRKAGGRLT